MKKASTFAKLPAFDSNIVSTSPKINNGLPLKLQKKEFILFTREKTTLTFSLQTWSLSRKNKIIYLKHDHIHCVAVTYRGCGVLIRHLSFCKQFKGKCLSVKKQKKLNAVRPRNLFYPAVNGLFHTLYSAFLV